MAFYLAFKEIWRNKTRFLLVSAVVALITTLVLFIAGLAEGLGLGQREFIQNLDAQVLVFRANVELSTQSSRLDWSQLNDVLRVEGVAAAGPIGFASSSIIFADGSDPVNISLIGVEPNQPGQPPVLQGKPFQSRRGSDVMIDRIVAYEAKLKIGDRFTIKSLQGTETKFYTLRVAGIMDAQRSFIQPAVIVPYLKWNEIKPKAIATQNKEDLTLNVVAVKLTNPADIAAMSQRLVDQIPNIEVATLQEAYESSPGYRPQQSTLSTQKSFSLLISLLVIGGFFHIQTLQKVAQVGMLKAIGASNFIVVLAALMQIVMVTTIGVIIGTIGTLLLALTFPVNIPIIFTPESTITTILTLLIIGPMGGLVSIRSLLKVEPLTALGLGG